MILKDIDQIGEIDLQALIDNVVLEGKTIEYKQLLPGNSDSDKKEFLADVSSFANAEGGDLIYGIAENSSTKVPTELKGLDIAVPDKELLRLENIIRDGLSPRLLFVKFKFLTLQNSKKALVIRVSQSWIKPHRVIFGGHDKFYSRSSNGKYPLDVTELRNIFILSDTINERIRRFKEERVSRIYSDDTPVPFYDNKSKIVLHLVPLITFSSTQRYDIDKIALKPSQLQQICGHGFNSKYNLEGFITYTGSSTQRSASYTQLYRNGIIEAVDGVLIRPHGEDLFIPSIAYEEKLITALWHYFQVMKIIGVEPPVLIFLTLLGVKGYRMYVNPGTLAWPSDFGPISNDILMLPEIIVENYDVETHTILKSSFDAIWNACGFPASRNYNDKGEWVGK